MRIMDFIPSTAKPATRQVLGWGIKRVVFWQSIWENWGLIFNYSLRVINEEKDD